MAIFHWDESYSVGIEQIDDQHRALLEMINRLDDAVSGGSDTNIVIDLLRALREYAVYHFATEEELMLAGGHDRERYRRHKAEHKEFVEQLERFGENLENGVSHAVAASLLEYLVQWLMEHVLGLDKEAGRFLLQMRDGADQTGAADAPRDRDGTKKKLLGALRESEVRFRSLADSVPVLVWMSDPNQHRFFFNRPWLEFTGCSFEELQRDGWAAGIHPDDYKATMEAHQRFTAQRQRFMIEYRMRAADGSYRWLLETAVPRYLHHDRFIGYIGSCVDITERKLAERVLEEARVRLEKEVAERTAELMKANSRLRQEKEEQRALIARLEETQQQLLQSEKMAAIGQLAAGIAHEINNPIGYVKSNLNTLAGYIGNLLHLIAAYEAKDGEEIEVMKRMMDYEFVKDDVITLMGETQEGVARIEKIVQDLREFANGDDAEWREADIHEGLDSTLNLLHNELRHKAQVIKQYGAVPPVRCLSAQLNQVFMHILLNAVQAVGKEGLITVRTRAEGDSAIVEVEDNGEGIPPDRINRIFDPFFTTKPVGAGTGLGLSISLGIVQRHGGQITVANEPEGGVTATVVLPRASAPPALDDRRTAHTTS